MDLRDYLRVVRRGWPVLVCATLVALLVGGAYISTTAPSYRASAQLLASPRDPETVSDLQVGAQYALSSAGTIAELVTSRGVLGAVAQQSADAALLVGDAPLTFAELSSSVTAHADPTTAVVTLDVVASEPRRAQQIAQQVAASAVTTLPRLLGSESGGGAPLMRVQVVEQPRVAATPSGPGRSQLLTVSALVGLALGLALTLTRQALDDRLRRPEDVRSVAGPGAVIPVPARRRAPSERPSIRGASVEFAEDYLAARVHLEALSAQRPVSIIVAPVHAHDCAADAPAGLAWAFADAGERVLLLDLDFRDAGVAPLFGLPSTAGSERLVSGVVDLRAAALPTKHERLDVVLGGPTPSPGQLLGEALSATITRCLEEYDVVVINVPAVDQYPDATAVARLASHTVLTARMGRTRARHLDTAYERLDATGTVAAAVLLTGMRRRRRPEAPAPPSPGRWNSLPRTRGVATTARREPAPPALAPVEALRGRP